MIDDKEDLICGLSWEQIKKAQSGKPFRKFVDLSKQSMSAPTLEDLDLLAKHGMEGLKNLGFFGVIDRIKNRKP
jgi:hypothetical protein